MHAVDESSDVRDSSQLRTSSGGDVCLKRLDALSGPPLQLHDASVAAAQIVAAAGCFLTPSARQATYNRFYNCAADQHQQKHKHQLQLQHELQHKHELQHEHEHKCELQHKHQLQHEHKHNLVSIGFSFSISTSMSFSKSVSTSFSTSVSFSISMGMSIGTSISRCLVSTGACASGQNWNKADD